MRRLLVFGGLLALGCGPSLPGSAGRVREVVLVAPDSLETRGSLSQILETEHLTPQPEPEFLVRLVGPERLSDFAPFHTIFLVGRIDDPSIMEILKGWVDLDRLKQRVLTDTFSLFRLHDLWARDQVVICFLARDRATLKRGLRTYASRIRGVIHNRFLERTHRLTYQRGYNRQATQRMAASFGFTIDVPLGFRLDERYRADNFVYIYGHNPDRSIFIHWRDGNVDLGARSVGSLLALRDSLTLRYYDGDQVLLEMSRSEPAEFQGRRAVRLQGVWQNERWVIGGPFISYLFNYEGRFYFIDGTLFAPGKRKLDNLLQLDAILKTFNPKVTG